MSSWKFLILLIFLTSCTHYPENPLPREPAILFQNNTVYLTENLVNEWNQLYIENNDVKETGLCITGSGTYYKGNITHSSFDDIGIQCKMSDIAYLHTHPEHDCRMSYTDIVESQKDSTFATGLICDVNKYVFWKNGNFLKVVIVEQNGTFSDITFKTNLAE